MRTLIITFLLCALSIMAFAQSIPVEGYIYESGNRGYLDLVTVKISNKDNSVVKSVITDRDGFFSFMAEKGSSLTLNIDKALYDSQVLKINVPSDKEKHFVNVEMQRSPGYLFEVTIAAEKSIEDDKADGLKGYRIDVYNNTKNKEEFVLEEYNQPVFQVPLIKENHYTVLIRKDGYMSKRIEAFVDIEGCILCFEGLGSVGPGVSETLSEQNTIGVLLANISMVKAYKGKKMQVNDIYYDLGKWNLKSKSKKELNKLAVLMKDNPRWIVELGSHTDSRGSDQNNLVLSEKRAQSAVDYLVIEKGIDRTRISAKGYGENNLINGCTDSKYCSESDHLVNRRTEIQIVGIAEKMRYQSLAEIKRSENMDALLQEIQFGEQVMVPVYNAKQDSFLSAKQDSIAKSLIDEVELVTDKNETINDEFKSSVFDDIDIEIEDEQEVSTSEVKTQFENKEELVQEIKEKTTDEIVEKEIPKNRKIENELSGLKYEKVVSRPAKNNNVKVDPVSSSENKEQVDKKINESTILVKIVLKESQEPLLKSDNIYSTHNGVKEIYHNGKFKYLFGEFTSLEQAKAFLNQSVKMVYPNAYVVKFN